MMDLALTRRRAGGGNLCQCFYQDPEFYAFYRSIDAYRKSMGKAGDLLVLDPDNDFFRYLNESDGSR